MRLALFGNHPHGRSMAAALVQSGRHELVTYSGPSAGIEDLRRDGLSPRNQGDVEVVLADPAIEAVIVASSPSVRAAQLKRALQSERHVLCVHPIDFSPDPAYEATMIRADTGKILLPLLTGPLHPGVGRLARAIRGPDAPLGALRLLRLECRSAGAILLFESGHRRRMAFPDWAIFRSVGGEIAEISASSTTAEGNADQPLLLSGRLEKGGMLQATLLPGSATASWSMEAVGSSAKARLLFPEGWSGPAQFTLESEASTETEDYPPWRPWPALADLFDRAVAASQAPGRSTGYSGAVSISWQDAIRCLELDDAVRRSLEHGRATALEFPEASEEATFKGTMTLVGCGLLWGLIALLVFSRWIPWLGWLVLPILAGFLALQLLRWILPRRSQGEGGMDR